MNADSSKLGRNEPGSLNGQSPALFIVGFERDEEGKSREHILHLPKSRVATSRKFLPRGAGKCCKPDRKMDARKKN
jgi:hypothetical protein